MYHLQKELSELENCSGRVPSKIEPAHFVVTEIGNMTLQECKVLPKGGRNIFWKGGKLRQMLMFKQMTFL